jgi:hypothetical protein
MHGQRRVRADRDEIGHGAPAEARTVWGLLLFVALAFSMDAALRRVDWDSPLKFAWPS